VAAVVADDVVGNHFTLKFRVVEFHHCSMLPGVLAGSHEDDV